MRNQLQAAPPSPTQVSSKQQSNTLTSPDEVAQRLGKMTTADEAKGSAPEGKQSTEAAESPQKGLQPQQDTAVISFPQVFEVKYLGRRDANGLWGIKYTRRPVDEMVSTAKELKVGETLPFLKLVVSEKGVNIAEMAQNINKNYEGGFYPIEVISYGVQDLVYTRVFAMIVVEEDTTSITTTHPFHCHAFVCDSRQSARYLTFALAQAFQQFSKQIKGMAKKPKKFAIDLRQAEEKEADLKEMDSEA